jgi:hypothetical protein
MGSVKCWREEHRSNIDEEAVHVQLKLNPSKRSLTKGKNWSIRTKSREGPRRGNLATSRYSMQVGEEKNFSKQGRVLHCLKGCQGKKKFIGHSFL